VPTVFFITHPDVAIDPAVAIPDWPLNSRGRERMRAITGWSWARGVRRVFASSERKARDAAEILAAGLGLIGYGIVAALGEADRNRISAKAGIRGNRRRVLCAPATERSRLGAGSESPGTHRRRG
jgi:phosphohistidine phosphatase SixA